MDALIYICCLTAVLVFFFWIIRGLIRLCIDYILNTSNRNKRRKGQTFADWIFYRRFRDVIPKKLLVWYLLHHIAYLVSVIATVVLEILGISSTFMRIPLAVYWYGSHVPAIATLISWSDIKNIRELNPGKSIERRKRNKK